MASDTATGGQAAAGHYIEIVGKTASILIVRPVQILKRLEYRGALNHIIVRGIERGKIFKDDQDRYNFIDRLGKTLEQTETGCFAWAPMPNHFDLLLRSDSYPAATVMH